MIDSFRQVLASSREEDVQQFLANNTSILLAAFGGQPGATVSECLPKFRFGSEFVSDFVIVTGHSYHYDIVLLELEPPTERPFTKAGRYARRTNGAIAQITDWLSWIYQHDDYFRSALAAQLTNKYGALQIKYPRGPMNYKIHQFVSAKIVIGRRNMLDERNDAHRGVLLQQTEKRIELVHYDRLLDIASAISSAQHTERS